MKKISVLLFSLILSLFLVNDISATNHKLIEKSNITKSGVLDTLDKPITSKTPTATKTQINNNEYKWSITTKEEGLDIIISSYYKEINKKMVNYKLELNMGTNGMVSNTNVLFRYNTNNKSNCSTQELGYGCVNMNRTLPILKTATTEMKYNGKLFSKSIFSFSTSGKMLTDVSYSYYNNRITEKETTYYNKYEENYKSIVYKYDSKKRITNKYIMNSNYNCIFSEVRKYYSNNKIKERYYMHYTNKEVKKHGRYFKYKTNGKIHTQKRISFTKKGKPSKMYTYIYNSNSKLKSTKKSKAYRYTTYYKVNSTKVNKVLKSQYNGKGKLQKAKKVKANKINKSFPTIKVYL